MQTNADKTWSRTWATELLIRLIQEAIICKLFLCIITFLKGPTQQWDLTPGRKGFSWDLNPNVKVEDSRTEEYEQITVRTVWR